MRDDLKYDVLIEEALKSQPLAPMPRSITTNVMARIQKDKRPSFFTWSDFVLSSVIAACMAALWFASEHLPPLLVAKIHIQGILLYQDFLVNARRFLPTVTFGLAALLVMLTLPYLIETFYKSSFRQ
jgi:hypothetical protein